MLSSEIMGSWLLGLSWLTAVMIALDAWIDARRLRGALARWKQELVEGQVQAAELATHEVEQRIKELDGDVPALTFFDRRHTSAVKGGTVTVAGETLEVVGAPDAEVWIDEATRQAAAACASPADFDAMKAKANGLRTVRTGLRAGQPVWLAGTKDGARFTATLVSNFDPRSFVRARLGRIAGLILANFAWVAAGTVLALWPPVFGLVSKLGAAVLLGHFLGMTPIAMAARERSRSPAIAFLRGTWKREGASLAPVAQS
ncbi:MAG: hypothetical protein ACOZQL_31200 [Myxococcota bacterium]